MTELDTIAQSLNEIILKALANQTLLSQTDLTDLTAIYGRLVRRQEKAARRNGALADELRANLTKAGLL